MKKSSALKILILSTLLSSCGLIGNSSSPEQPTDSKDAVAVNEAKADDLFSESMNDQNKSQDLKTVADDKPSNVTTNETKDEMAKLDDDFSANGPKESQINETPTEKVVVAEAPAKQEKATKAVVVEEAPIIKKEEVNSTRPQAGRMMHYKVKKGETLMQVAFKIYGDIGKWKELKEMNRDTLAKSSALKNGMDLKYAQPEKDFVWNPEGTAYMIKNGETLGVISNNVYQTPKKWKKIYENNKPLIKNPNIIFAGFTLYYKPEGMANYVQPKSAQPKVAKLNIVDETKTDDPRIDEVKVDEALSKLEEANASEVDLTKEIQSSTVRETTTDLKDELKQDEQIDEALPN